MTEMTSQARLRSVKQVFVGYYVPCSSQRDAGKKMLVGQTDLESRLFQCKHIFLVGIAVSAAHIDLNYSYHLTSIFPLIVWNGQKRENVPTSRCRRGVGERVRQEW